MAINTVIKHVRRHRRIGLRSIYTPVQLKSVRQMARQLALQALRFTGRCDIDGAPIYFPRLPLAEFLFDEIFVGHEYFLRLENTSPFIVDCGANIGFATRYFHLLYPKARIVAFEPNPSAFSFLERNIQQLESVVAHSWALAKSRGQITLAAKSSEASVRASTHHKEEGGNATLVETHPLSCMLDCDVDLLKLDVEGAETDVVEELIDSGAIERVRNMWIEYHLHCGGRSDLSYFLSLLESAGFRYQMRANFAASSMHPHYEGTCQGVNILSFRNSRR